MTDEDLSDMDDTNDQSADETVRYTEILERVIVFGAIWMLFKTLDFITDRGESRA